MNQNDFDPLAYIENAFLDRQPKAEKDAKAAGPESPNTHHEDASDGLKLPSITSYIQTAKGASNGSQNGHANHHPTGLSPNGLNGAGAGATAVAEREAPTEAGQKAKFRKTEMSAPRPRRAKATQPSMVIEPGLQTTWEALPRNIEFLCSFYDDAVTANYYRGEFKESRTDLIQRLLDPELSLEETSRLLGVCPATVRRYTNRSWLNHHRSKGGQRRFRLSDVVKFVELHGRFPEE